jgi:FMN phosphatase YigB (HAD superfamily)
MSEEGPVEVPMAYWPEVKAIAGAGTTLAKLALRYRLHIATNAVVSKREDIQLALERASLWQYISEIFCYTELGMRKDNPEFWAAVLSRLGVDASDVAMVGDSLEQDVIAPRAAGIFAVWFNENGKHPPPVFEVPAITRLDDIVQWVGAP